MFNIRRSTYLQSQDSLLYIVNIIDFVHFTVSLVLTGYVSISRYICKVWLNNDISFSTGRVVLTFLTQFINQLLWVLVKIYLVLCSWILQNEVYLRNNLELFYYQIRFLKYQVKLMWTTSLRLHDCENVGAIEKI